MKWKNCILLLLLIVSLSGCVVFSFYPIYSEKDLFPNNYLLGNYISSDSVSWSFEFKKKRVGDIDVPDSTAYVLNVLEDKDSSFISKFSVHLIKIDGILIADFFLEDYTKKDNGVRMFDLHIIPVHTFAKVLLTDNGFTFKWVDGDWLKKLINGNKVRIRHENNGEFILLTAKSSELQKFLKKYLNSEDAFKDGLEVKLMKKVK
jgi:hypothetical protein